MVLDVLTNRFSAKNDREKIEALTKILDQVNVVMYKVFSLDDGLHLEKKREGIYDILHFIFRQAISIGKKSPLYVDDVFIKRLICKVEEGQLREELLWAIEDALQ